MAENTELDASALTATNANQQQDFASLMSSNNQSASSIGSTVETSSDGPGGDPLGEAMRYSQYVGRQQLQNKIAPPTSLVESLTYQKSPGIRYLDADSIANFTQQESYNPDGFNPKDPTNYTRFAARETWGTALSKGFDSMSSKFGAAFKENFVGYGRLGSALANMDMSLLMASEDEMMQQYYQDQKDAQKNFVFQKPEDQDSIFSKGSVSEFIGSSGFMLGTFAALSLEIAADILITAATVPSGGEGAALFAPTFAKIGANFGRLIGKEALEAGARESAEALAKKQNMFREAAEGFTLGNKSAEEIRLLNKIGEASAISNTTGSAARQALNDTFTVFNGNLPAILKSKTVLEMTGNVARGLPLVGTGIRYGEKVVAGVEAGVSTAKLMGIGAQGLRRVVQEYNMSATEASFEAVSSYGDTLNKLVENHRMNNNGDNPNEIQFEEMRKLSMDSSGANYKTNMAILLATNKLQFGNMFNKFLPANKTMRELIEASKDNLVLVEKNGLKKFYKKGFAGAYGVTGQIARDFGKKEATFQVGKAFFKDMTRFELVEGLQENLQSISANGWKDYYIGQYQKSNSILSESFGKAFEDEISKQGLKTFLMGALTGTLVRLPVHMTTKGLEAASNKLTERQYAKNPGENPVERVKKQFDKDIETLNTFFKQTEERAFKHKIVNFVNQVQEGQNQAEAAAKGLRYEFENSRDNALVSAISAAKRTESIDVLQRAVSEMGVDMTNEDFEKSFGVKLEDTKYATPLDFTRNLSKDIKKYSDVTDGIRNKVKNFTEPTLYTPGTKDYFTAMIARSAEEDAVHTIAMNAIKSDMTAKRAQQISQELLSNKSLANSSDYAIRVLTDPKYLNDEKGNVISELKIYEENLKQNTDLALTDKLKKQIEDKKQELEHLKKWQSFFSTRPDVNIGLNAEGEVETQENIVLDTFVGKRIDKMQTLVDGYGEPLDIFETTFDTNDNEVIETFRQLINVKNKQSGLDVQISETEMRDVHSKLVDYMKLDKDTKDYMSAVDTLMNPENFKHALGKMTDGKMKFYVLSWLDRFNYEIYNNIEGPEGLVASLNETGKLNKADIVLLVQDIWNAVYENENYKNLLTISLDPNLGINNSEYAQKLVDKLRDDVVLRFSEIVKKYTPSEYAEDLTNEEYDDIIATGKIEPVKEQLLVDKIARGEIELGPNEQKIVNSEQFKASIEAQVLTAKQKLVQKTTGTEVFQDSDGKFGVVSSNGEVITEGYNTEEEALAASQEMTNTSEIPVSEILETTPGQKYADMSELELQHRLDDVNESFDEMIHYATQEEIDDLLKEKNYILEAIRKKANQTPASNPPEIEDVAEPDNIIVPIPETLSVGTPIFYVNNPSIKGVITGIDLKTNTVAYETDKVDNEEDYSEFIKSYAVEEQPPVTPPAASITPAAPVAVSPVTSTAAPTPDVTQISESNEDGFVSLSEENFMRSLMGLPPLESMEPFVVETNNEETYDIKDSENNTVQTFTTEKKAQEVATSANNTRKDVDFVKKFMDEVLTNVEDKIDIVMYTSMLSRGERSMKLYNKKHGTEYKTLEQYAAKKHGRKSLEGIRESVITGKKIKYQSKKVSIKKPTEEVQVNLFDTVNTPDILSTNRNILESLNNELSDFKSIVEENSKEISKFVDEGTISESSILEQLKEAAKCFK
jgi:hypothetical protein